MPPTNYTHGHERAVLASHSWRTVPNSAPHLIPYLVSGARVLDVGCGPGTITADIAVRVGQDNVLGIDPAEAAIAEARSKHPGIRFEVGDVHAIEGTWDIVHAHQVLQHLADPVQALRDMSAAAPGGVVAVRDADYGAMTWYPHAPALDRWREVYSETARANGGEPDAGRRLANWCRAAGLGDVTITASTWCFTGDDIRWWASTWARRISSGTLAETAIDGGFASQALLDELADGWLRWADAPDALFLVPSVEVIARP